MGCEALSNMIAERVCLCRTFFQAGPFQGTWQVESDPFDAQMECPELMIGSSQPVLRHEAVWRSDSVSRGLTLGQSYTVECFHPFSNTAEAADTTSREKISRGNSVLTQILQ